MFRTLLPVLLLVGCNPGLNALVPEVRIIDVEPDQGHISGGLPVTVTGFGFEGNVAVWFGNTALPTTLVDDVTLVVTSPAVAEAGPVNVRVTGEFGEATLKKGFTYVTEATDTDTTDTDTPDTDTTDTDTTDTGTTDTDIAPTGLTGGLIQFVLTQVACMDCFPGWHPSELDITADAALHEPVAESWTGWWPAPGTCTVNPVPTAISAQRYDVGPWMYLTSGGVQVVLEEQADLEGPRYVASGLDIIDFVHPVYYALSANGGPDLGAVDIADAVLTPSGFDIVEPWQMLLVSQASAFTAPFSKSGAPVTWSPTGPGTVIFLIMVFNPAGTLLQGQVLCQDTDDGSFTIPATALSSFQAQSPVGIYMYRTELTESVIPNNGHTLQSVAQMGFLGTGVLTP